MSIIGVRIDSRMIHGQVANLWVPSINPTRIMIIDDHVAGNEIEKSGLKMATPAGIKLSILPFEKALKNISEGRYDSQKVLLIVKDPTYLLKLVNSGIDIEEVNVGNISKRDNTRSITKSVNITDEEEKAFEELHNKGVNLISQMVPNEKAQDFYELL